MFVRNCWYVAGWVGELPDEGGPSLMRAIIEKMALEEQGRPQSVARAM